MDGQTDSPSWLDEQQPSQLLALMPPQEVTASENENVYINLSKSQVLPAFNFILDVYDVHLATAGQQVGNSPLAGKCETVEVSTRFLSHNEKLQFNFSPIIPTQDKNSPPSKKTEENSADRLEVQIIGHQVVTERCSYKCMKCQEEFESDEDLEKHIKVNHESKAPMTILYIYRFSCLAGHCTMLDQGPPLFRSSC